jgi:hypothetical protein
MKQVFLLIIGVVIFISAIGFLTQNSEKQPLADNISVGPVSEKQRIKIGNREIEVEIADTERERKKGLSGRTSLEEGQGMLFVFQQKERPAFWMKGMKFSIDIIWVENGKIVQIDKNILPPTPGIPDNQLKLYLPSQPIDHVLEVRAGFTEENNIKVGDTITLN